MMKIYHNPKCGTSRNVLAMIKQSGSDVEVIEYLKTPPSRNEIKALVKDAGITLRDALRQKGAPYDELGLDDEALDDEALLDAIEAHPILLNRPFVVSSKGTVLARPSEKVLTVLEHPLGDFVKEDGQAVKGQ